MVKIKKKYKVAIVGCGNIGALFESEPKREKPASHAGAVVANKRTELVALVDTNEKNLASAHKLFPRASCYASLSECLKIEKPDIVSIATPPTVRLATLKECVRYGVSMVVCEKPLATSVKEAKQIEVLIAKSGMTFVLNYQRRFSSLFVRVRAEIKKGKFGRIQQVTCYYSNGLCNNGGHTIDAVGFLLDDEIVSAIGLNNTKNKMHPTVDANIDALLVTKRGTIITLQSFDQKEYGIHDIRIFGTKGSANLTDYGITLVETPAHESRFAGVKQLDTTRECVLHSPLSATKDALAHAIECYEKDMTSASSVSEGLSTLRVLDAIAKSARQNGKKTLV